MAGQKSTAISAVCWDALRAVGIGGRAAIGPVARSLGKAVLKDENNPWQPKWLFLQRLSCLAMSRALMFPIGNIACRWAGSEIKIPER